MDVEGTITLKGNGYYTYEFPYLDELCKMRTPYSYHFKCSQEFPWRIEPTVHLSSDSSGPCSIYASFEVKPTFIRYMEKKHFVPSQYTSDPQNYLLVGCLELSYYSTGSQMDWRKTEVSEDMPPNVYSEMPLQFRITMLPIGKSGRLEFELHWGLKKKKKQTTADTELLVRQTCFNLPAYLMNPKFSDVVFNVRGARLQAHKLILAAKSPVFDANFSHEMKEKQTGCVVIDDIAPEVFRELLRFFYTDELPVEVLKKHGASLLLAADKYDLPKLVDFCMPHALNDQTPLEDILRLYVLASSRGITSNSTLKTNIIELIGLKGRIFTKSEAFVTFMKDYPRIASEIIADLVEK